MAGIRLIRSSLWSFFFLDFCTTLRVKCFLAPYAAVAGIVTCWISGRLMVLATW